MDDLENLDAAAKRREHAEYMRDWRRRRLLEAMCGKDSPTKGNLAESRKTVKQPRQTREESLAEHETMKQRVVEVMERNGVDLGVIAKVLKEGLGSTLVWRTYDREDKEVIERVDPDYRTRQKYLETAADLLRVRPSPHEQTQQTGILILNLPTGPEMSIEEWNRTVAAKATTEHDRLVPVEAQEEDVDEPQEKDPDPEDA